MRETLIQLSYSNFRTAGYKKAVSNIAQLLHYCWTQQADHWNTVLVKQINETLPDCRGVMRHKIFLKKLSKYLSDGKTLSLMTYEQRSSFLIEAKDHIKNLRANIDIPSLGKVITNQIPTISYIKEEINATLREFGSLKVKSHSEFLSEFISRNIFLSVLSDDIIIEDIRFRDFEIEFRVRTYCSPVSVFDGPYAYAQTPNYPPINDINTHPHINAHRICTGSAQSALSNAIRTCSLSEYFMLCNSLLKGYLEDDAYLSIAIWKGDYFTCTSCGDIKIREEHTTVTDTDGEFCTFCVWGCRNCSDISCISEVSKYCPHDHGPYCLACYNESRKSDPAFSKCLCG